VAGTFPKTPTGSKTSVVCPHCGASQLESVFARSTICRKCSRHFPIGAPDPSERTGLTQWARALSRVKGWLGHETVRLIQCFGCGANQQVSGSARSSLCPHCGAYIDLRDFRISGPFSRSIETQGSVLVLPKGDVTSARVLCAEAFIRGRLHGSLICTGTTRVKCKGRFMGAVDTQLLVVEKRSEVEFVRPVKARTVEIYGKTSARVMADSVRIGKSGALDGTVYAKAIVVERGGLFHGELVIGKREMVQPDLLSAADEEASGGSLQAKLAFG
jgi:cytoskeletal protein CcmA (bactofilin family)/predicted RNA-binding Zn-ribbon protein involved in translation (DUF1610 family)